MSALVQALAQTAESDAELAWVQVAHRAGVQVVARLGARAWAEYSCSNDTGVTGALTATGTAVPVDNGYLVSGGWQGCYGLRQAGWIVVPAITEGPGRATVVMVPAWQCTRTANAGAGTVWMNEVMVPAHRSVAVEDLLDGISATDSRPDALSGQPIVPVLTALTAGPCLGIARAVADTVGRSRVPVPVTHIHHTHQALATITDAQTRAISTTMARLERLVSGLAEMVDRRIRTGHRWNPRDRSDCRARLDEVVGLTEQLCDAAMSVHCAHAGNISALSFLRRIRDPDGPRTISRSDRSRHRGGYTLI